MSREGGAAVPVELPGGEVGEVIAWDGATLVLRSPRAFAPGAPLRAVLRLPDGPCEVELKSGGSRRPDGAAAFEVRGRAVNLRRETRARLAPLLSPPRPR
jgi:hypothetical protein